MSEESASPRADGRAAGGHTCTPEEEGPTPPAFALVAEVGSMGDDAGPEQLDWGSIDDEDGAFGQLSEASNIQDSDPPLSGGLLSGERQVPAADEPIGGAGGAVAITPGASAAMHSSGELEEREMRGEPAAGCSAQQGILQGADLDFPGAPKSSKRQVFIARSSIVHQAAAGLGGDKGRPQSGPLHGPASELADSPDSAAGQSASAGADGPLPDGATPNTSVRETDRGAQSRSVEDTALNAADTALLCGDSRGINAPADSVAEAGTRNHGRIKRNISLLLGNGGSSACGVHRCRARCNGSGTSCHCSDGESRDGREAQRRLRKPGGHGRLEARWRWRKAGGHTVEMPVTTLQNGSENRSVEC